MSAHTAGPWRAVSRITDQGANWSTRIPYAIERVVGNAVAPIADVCDQPQAAANAALLAAAPCLLAALRGMIDEASSSVEFSDWPELREAIAIGEAAIDKATGAPA